MPSRYEELYARSLADPEGFWGEAAEDIYWDRRWDRVLDRSREPFSRWFAGGMLNTCYNTLDFHIDRGRGKQKALVYDSPVTRTVRAYTYAELRDEVARLAGALRRKGVAKGDRVIIYMPMVPEAVMAMLACARIGAVHSVVFGGFAPNELAKRIDDARPRLILSASCGIEVNRVIAYKPLLDAAIDIARHKPDGCVILQRPQEKAPLVAGRDVEWGEFVAGAPAVECVPVAATDPLYILYTSGTTGIPKGVVHDNGGHAVALKWSMQNVYGMGSGETYWAASDIGWVVGHSYIVYAPLLKGCTTILYEGKPVGTPDPGAFWRVVAEHGVSALFTAPTAFRAIKKEDPDGAYMGKYDLSRFRTLFLAGERCDPDTLLWARERLGVPVIDHWWQTETAWPIAANCVGMGMLPVKPGSPTKSVPGYEVHVLDEDNRELPAGQIGSIAIKLPLPPGCLPTLWNNDDGYVNSYLTRHPGHYLTGDAGYRDEDGYVLHHEPRGRHHQRRRPPALDGRDGRGARLASRRGGVRGGGRGRRPEGRGARRLRRDQGRRGAERCRRVPRGRRAGARADRPGRLVPHGGGGEAAAEDALGQDPARDDEEDGGRRRAHRARHDRGPGGARGDRRVAPRPRLSQVGRALVTRPVLVPAPRAGAGSRRAAAPLPRVRAARRRRRARRVLSRVRPDGRARPSRRPRCPRRGSGSITLSVMLVTVMQVLDTSITNVALPHMQGSLSTSVEETSWVITSYLAANAIVIPATGWLTGVLGRRRLFLICAQPLHGQLVPVRASPRTCRSSWPCACSRGWAADRWCRWLRPRCGRSSRSASAASPWRCGGSGS